MKRRHGDHGIYQRVRVILESARAAAVRSVNTAQVVANWLVGREVVEEEQRGARKARYGQKLITEDMARTGDTVPGTVLLRARWQDG